MVSQCPTDNTLAALVACELGPEELGSHFDDCAMCQSVAVRPDAETLPSIPACAVSNLTGSIQIGRYQLGALVGMGGMGAVYKAYDAKLGRVVALKLLRPGLCGADELAAKVTHPAVITVYDVGREGPTVFVAMELIRGSTLAAWLAANRLDWREIVALFERAGRGLAAAHDAGIVHRDFKPDNVLVDHGGRRIVVTNFGVAREAVAGSVPVASDGSQPAPSTIATAHAAVVGTPSYMAPEQLHGRDVDRRADVFAFSASLWEALLGARPFPGRTAVEISAIMQQPLGRPARARRVPARLLRALHMGLAIDPCDRWSDITALLDELAAIRGRRTRRVLAATGVGLVGLGISAALVMVLAAPSPDRCTSALAPLEHAYNPRLEAAVGDALAPPSRSAVLARLGATAHAWQTAHLTTCHDNRDIAQDAWIAACLASRRIELAGSVDDLIANGPAGARYAVQISEVPGDPAACVTPAAGLLFARVPDDRALRRRVTALRERLADAKDATDRGEFEHAIELTTQVVADAATTWPSVHAEAQLALGELQRQDGDSKLAISTLRDAAVRARAANDDLVVARSWIQLAYAAVSSGASPAGELEYVELAQAAADRIGRPAGVMAQIATLRGNLLTYSDREAEAVGELRRAVELARTASDQDLEWALQSLAYAYSQQGRYRDAADLLQRAIEHLPHASSGELVGAAVPLAFEQLAFNLSLLGSIEQAEAAARHAVEVADRIWPAKQIRRTLAHFALAWILQYAGHGPEALIENTGSVAALEQLQSPRSMRYGDALYQQGVILNGLGRYAEAEPLLARACEIVAFTRGEVTSSYALCEVADAAAMAVLNRHAGALRKLDHALTTMTSTLGGSHPTLASVFTTRAREHAALHHHHAAITDFERAIEILSVAQMDPGYLASATWQLGRELWTDDPPRARTEVIAALSRFQTAPAKWSEERAAAAAWLAAHPLPSAH